MPTTLKEIIVHKRNEVDRAKVDSPLSELKKIVESNIPPRNFFGAVVNGHTRGSTSVIAEVKRKSPSAGLIRDDFNAANIATAYEKAGAAAISCLTDEQFFGGKLAFIKEIRDVVSLPVLRKDFIVDAYQIWEARAAGADAVLLIAEVLPEGQLMDFMILAHELRMTSLVEAHSMDELLKIQTHIGFPHAGYSLLGINNRNLKTMQTDISHTIRMVDVVEDTSVVVSESGQVASAWGEHCPRWRVAYASEMPWRGSC
jgi:indole-3-glycerol phosphate synthase